MCKVENLKNIAHSLAKHWEQPLSHQTASTKTYIEALKSAYEDAKTVEAFSTIGKIKKAIYLQTTESVLNHWESDNWNNFEQTDNLINQLKEL